MIKIRKFEKKDAEQASKIIFENIEHSRHLNKKEKEIIKKRSKPEKLIKRSKKADYFVCEKNKKIIAIGGLMRNEIRTMYTSLKYQNRGIGSRILKKIENHAKKKGKKKLFLYTHKRAFKFYQQNGYKLLNLRKYHDRKMYKRLKCNSTF